jgi:hypothetical protein
MDSYFVTSGEYVTWTGQTGIFELNRKVGEVGGMVFPFQYAPRRDLDYSGSCTWVGYYRPYGRCWDCGSCNTSTHIILALWGK